MIDLVPFVTFLASVLALGLTIALLRKYPARGAVAARVALALIVGLVAICAPYAAYLLVTGDPDVWDFYRAYAWVAVAILVILGIFAARVAIGRPAP